MAPQTSYAKKHSRKKEVVAASIGKRPNLPAPKDYVSPVKKRREAVAQRNTRVIATAQELRAYAKETKHDYEVVSIYGLFLWASYHVTKLGRNIIHLLFYDSVSNDSVKELLEDYKYDGERNFDSDMELMTAAVWDGVEGCDGLPTEGNIVRISRFSGLSVFGDEACQFNTSLADVHVEPPDQHDGGETEEKMN